MSISSLGRGLNILIRDVRDRGYRLSGVFTQPDIAELPLDFTLNGSLIKDQGTTDFCSQFATCGASELQENVSLAPEFNFALSKLESGDLDIFGQNLRFAAGVHVKYGALESKDSLFSVNNRDSAFLRNIANWGDLNGLLVKAIPHKKKSYMWTSGKYDGFDNIRTWIWKFRSENRAVVMGLRWAWPSNMAYIDMVLPGGVGHAVRVVGWKTVLGKPYLVIANSWGANVGDGGYFYLSREVVNSFVDMFGALMFQDLTPEEVAYYVQNGTKKDEPWVTQLLKALFTIIKEIFRLNTAPFPAPEELIPENNMTIMDWAQAIKEYEGWIIPGSKDSSGKVYPYGSASYRNNNPGNFRYNPSGYRSVYGTVVNNSGFAKFTSYDLGLLYCHNWLRQIATGVNTQYNGYVTTLGKKDCSELSFNQFYEKYAPTSDGNFPRKYASFIAARLGVSPDATIKSAISIT